MPGLTRLTVILLRPAAVDGADDDGVLYLTLSRGFNGCDLIEAEMSLSVW